MIGLRTTGSVTDDDEAVDITGGALTLETGSGAGSPTAPIESNVDSVAGSVSTSGGIFIDETDGLQLGTISLAADTHIAISTGDGELEFAGNIAASASGSVRLESEKNILLSTGSSISSEDGDIMLNATGTTSGSFDGIRLDNASTMTTNGEIKLTGSGGTNSGAGVLLENGSTVGSTDGNIQIVGSSSNGNDYEQANNSAIQSTNGQIEINANTIDLTSGAISSSGELVIQPRVAATSIGLGDSATGTLNLNNAELGRLQAGFASIVLGDSDSGTGAVDVNASTFSNPLHIVGGSITVTELNAGAIEVTLTARTGSISNGGDVGSDVSASSVTLNSLAGEIGSSGDAISLDAAFVTSDTSTSNSDQFLATAGFVAWNSSTAGTGTATLDSGQFNLPAGQNVAGNVELENGATLSGEGTVVGRVIVLAGGTLSPGSNRGILNTRDLQFLPNSRFDVDLVGDTPGVEHDQVLVNGIVEINNATLDISHSGFIPGGHERIILIDNDGTDEVVGQFDNLPQGAVIGIAGFDAVIIYDGGDGNDVEIVFPVVYDFSQAAFSTSEQDVLNTSTVVTVTRNRSTTATSVDIVLSGQTADAGSDFTAGPITIDFEVGVSSVNVPIEILGDTLVELNETVALSFANLTGTDVVGTSQPASVLTILENDSAVFSFSRLMVPEGNTNQTSHFVTATLTNPVDVPIYVEYSLAAGSATAGEDFQPLSSSFVFPAGAVTVNIQVGILGDSIPEPDETFYLNVDLFENRFRNVDIIRPTSEIVIVNDDLLRIAGVKVGSTEWTPAFKSHLDPTDRFGYTIPTGVHQMAPLPWANINQIRIKFTQDISTSFHANLIGLGGVRVADYRSEFSSVDYNPSDLTVTMTLNSFLGDEQLILVASDEIHSRNIALDGEWDTGQSIGMSGNGHAGGTFAFRFDVLPGDVNQSGGIRANDGFAALQLQFQDLGTPNYYPFADIDGNGRIRANDGFFALSRQFSEPPKSVPNLPPFPAPVLVAAAVNAAFADEQAKELGEDDFDEELLSVADALARFVRLAAI